MTCKNGSTTKTTQEKSGTWTFSGITNGTWTVTATLGGQTTTKTVNVTQFDVYRVTLEYLLYLYKNGDGENSKYGPWVIRNANGADQTVTYPEGNLKLHTVGEVSTIWQPKNFDPSLLSKYSKLVANIVDFKELSGIGIYLRLGISSKNDGFGNWDDIDKAYVNTGKIGKIELDISKLTTGYITACGYFYETTFSEIYLTN